MENIIPSDVPDLRSVPLSGLTAIPLALALRRALPAARTPREATFNSSV
jgi:hypothetical protein